MKSPQNIYVRFRKALFLVCIFAFSSSVYAAFCSLRDPVFAIQTLMPNATHHRSVVKTVSNTSRNYVRSQLRFDLHFNEIGRHTLYIVFEDEMPLGVVHSRSEASSWGLIEFAWALDMDGKVKDFFFQRCRSAMCADEKLKAKILDELRGKGLAELKILIDDETKGLISTLKNKYGKASILLETAIVSALKTIALTRAEWQNEIDQEIEKYLLLEARKSMSFGSGAVINRLNETQVVSRVPVSDLVAREYIDLDSVRLYSVTDASKKASVVTTKWMVGEESGHLMLVFDSSGALMAFSEMGDSIDPQSNAVLDSLLGRRLRSEAECETITELVGSTLYKLVSYGSGYKEI